MKHAKSAIKHTDLIEYAIDVLTEALREGYIEPITLIEFVQSAADPTRLAAIRAVTALDPSAQRQVISFANGLSEQYLSAGHKH